MDKKGNNKLNSIDIYIIIACFIIYLTWAIIIPYNHAPDEYMRYKIPEFIYKYGYLPHGSDARIRDATWGFSYAFTPIFSYIVSALFMKITSFFTTSVNALLLSARMVSVLASTGTAYFSIKISKKLFDGVFRYVFVIATVILPEFVFVSAYVNNDAFGIFTVAWIVYGLILSEENEWNIKSCIFLGCGVGLCALSYFNCYGIILVALFYGVVSVVKNKNIEDKFGFLLSRFACVLIVALIVAGWWFIRNAIIYNGDFLGLRASSECAEMYAAKGFKPSQRVTLSSMNISLRSFLAVYYGWTLSTYESFIGKFDYMSLSLPMCFYYIFLVIIFISLIGLFMMEKRKKNKENGLLSVSMIFMCVITVFISVWYSYFNDFQAQGRYLLPMLIPINILLVTGWSGFFEKKDDKAKLIMAFIIVVIYVATVIESTMGVIVPAYL